MAKGKTKGAVKHRALPRKRCCRAAYAGYYVSAAKRAARRWEVFELHAGLHGWSGHNTAQLASDLGVLLWVGLKAAELQGLALNGGDAHYLAHGADVLGLVRAKPNRLRLLRPRILNCLEAVKALRPRLLPVPLAEAERRLRWQLSTKGYVGTTCITAMTRMQAFATPAAA